MTECRVEIVPPKEANHTAPQPDALRIACGPCNRSRRFGQVIALPLILARIPRRRFPIALGDGGGCGESEKGGAERDRYSTQ